MGIAEVLAKIDLSPIEGAFKLTFVKGDGSLRTIEKAQKGHKVQHTSSSPTSNFKYQIKEKGVVIVANLDATNPSEKFRTVKISRILRFNDITVTH